MVDTQINSLLQTIQTPTLTKLFLTITNFGNIIVLGILSTATIYFGLKKKKYGELKQFLLAMSLGFILSNLIKIIIKRSRPIPTILLEKGYSFPSVHSTMAIIFFGMIIYLFKDEIKNKINKKIFVITNIILIVLIGLSRIYLNVHYTTDVLAGFILGFACILISIKINIFKK